MLTKFKKLKFSTQTVLPRSLVYRLTKVNILIKIIRKKVQTTLWRSVESLQSFPQINPRQCFEEGSGTHDVTRFFGEVVQTSFMVILFTQPPGRIVIY